MNWGESQYFTMWLKNKWAVFSAEHCLGAWVKKACLEYQSTFTSTHLQCSLVGKPTMKSIETLFHRLLGIGRGFDSHTGCFLLDLVVLTHKISLHIGLHITLQLRPIIGVTDKSKWAVYAQMTRSLAIMTFLHDLPLKGVIKKESICACL